MVYNDGRFKLGDEIINVNGKSLRGVSMEEARNVLRGSCHEDIDIILGRDGFEENSNTNGNSNTSVSNMNPVERRRRRKLPLVERPRSAPIHQEEQEREDDLESTASASAMKTVIKIGQSGERIEQHMTTSRRVLSSCVDTPSAMTPAQSVENFYNERDDLDDSYSVASEAHLTHRSVLLLLTLCIIN